MKDKIKTILAGIEGLEERTKNSDCGTEFRNGQNRAYVLVKELIYQKFPELQESEDERIRKWIVNYIHHGAFNEEEHPMALKAIEWLEKQKEQELHLTVKGKGVYKICPLCKSRMIRDDSKVYTSMPPQYGYNCPKCGTMEFDTTMYDSPETKEQKPDVKDPFDDEQFRRGYEAGKNDAMREQKPEWSEEDEKVRDSIIEYIDSGNIYATSKVNMITWLKFLPERFNLQPKSEWSEEDNDAAKNHWTSYFIYLY